MIINYLQNLDTLSLALLVFIVLFGVSYGVRNFLISLSAIFLAKSVVQSTLGKLVQFSWYVSIIGFIVLNY